MSTDLRISRNMAFADIIATVFGLLLMAGPPAYQVARADDAKPDEKPTPAIPAEKEAPKNPYPFTTKLNPREQLEFAPWPEGWELVDDGRQVKLMDQSANRQIGVSLSKKSLYPEERWPPYRRPQSLAVSPDGNFLVVGYGFKEHRNRQELPTNIGRVVAYHLPTGKKIEISMGRLGAVDTLKFTKDGQTLCVYAETFSLDGP